MANYSGTTGKSARQELDKYKMEAASEAGVDLNKANLTAKEAGTVGGRMVRNMINKAKNAQ